MEEIHSIQDSETASVVKIAREPAIIINGVPDLPPDCTSESQPEPSNAAEPQVDHRFGEWLEGRRVRKLFGDKYYVGKVVKYDSESNWYSVAYEDGDQEDLEWHEVEEVLLPLDITIPLKALVMDKSGLTTVPDFRSKTGRSRKVYAIMEGNTNTVLDMVPISQGSNVTYNEVMTGADNGQQPNNVLALLPAPVSNDASDGQLVSVPSGENAQACAEASNQPRKRGRPRKDSIVPAIISQPTQPRKRGRPRKDSTVPANSQPKKRGRPPKKTSMSGNGQSANSHDSVLKRNSQTAKAEKQAKAERLKSERIHVQGAPPGTP